ncbi:hypothetical protein ACFQO4_19005 [Saliphagus sp. GCM10025334]|uniref:type II toxin-antitoxin system HicB family antitoxin n=1 Tax=Natronosalvus caseinilyticus TaxID=2953747 RepID=UPI0028AED398|nr:hypothetical protein [Natronosalvus caseinilyticus]
MATATHDNGSEGVKFIHEDDGSITAVDLETGIASFGDSKPEALTMLADALELYEGGGDPVTDEDLEEWGLDLDTAGDQELPGFMH